MSNIYVVTDLSEVYGGEAAYGVEHIHEGIVSVWTDHEMALEEAYDLDYCA